MQGKGRPAARIDPSRKFLRAADAADKIDALVRSRIVNSKDRTSSALGTSIPPITDFRMT